MSIGPGPVTLKVSWASFPGLVALECGTTKMRLNCLVALEVVGMNLFPEAVALWVVVIFEIGQAALEVGMTLFLGLRDDV